MLRLSLSFLFATSLLFAGCSQDGTSAKQSLMESKWALQAIVNAKTGDLELIKNAAVLKFIGSDSLSISTQNKQYKLFYYIDESAGRAVFSNAASTADAFTKKISLVDNFELTGSCLRLIDSKSDVFFVFERSK